ncbi:MAG: histidine kinase [Novosphingobium sp.]|nr:histidine kinase [Novosphingobium sp.]
MKTMTRVLAATLALGSAVAMSGSAHAHDWRGNGWGYDQPWGGGWQGGRGDFGGTCSGQRGYGLERALRFKTSRGLIDFRAARRIQGAIDRLQWREQHECSEGDWRAVRRINREYDRIDQWIDEEAGRYRGGYWDH